MTTQMNIDGLFTSLLSVNKFEDIDNERLNEYCLYMYKNNPSNQRSNRNGWQSHHLQPHQALDELVGKVKGIGQTLFNFMKGKPEWKIELDNIWININTPGSYNTTHIHPRSFLSGVYYVKVPENSGKIHFDHPCQFFTYDWDGSYFEELNNINSSGMYYPTEEKKNYLFPSWLGHSVESNNSKENRISISYNLKLVR